MDGHGLGRTAEWVGKVNMMVNMDWVMDHSISLSLNSLSFLFFLISSSILSSLHELVMIFQMAFTAFSCSGTGRFEKAICWATYSLLSGESAWMIEAAQIRMTCQASLSPSRIMAFQRWKMEQAKPKPTLVAKGNALNQSVEILLDLAAVTRALIWLEMVVKMAVNPPSTSPLRNPATWFMTDSLLSVSEMSVELSIVASVLPLTKYFFGRSSLIFACLAWMSSYFSFPATSQVIMVCLGPIALSLDKFIEIVSYADLCCFPCQQNLSVSKRSDDRPALQTQTKDSKRPENGEGPFVKASLLPTFTPNLPSLPSPLSSCIVPKICLEFGKRGPENRPLKLMHRLSVPLSIRSALYEKIEA